GREPTVVLGRPAPQLGGWARTGPGAHVVAEWPDGGEGLGGAVPSLTVWLRSAGGAASGVGLALGRPSVDCSGGSESAESPEQPESFSLEPGGDWWGSDVRERANHCRFRVFYRGGFVTEVALPVAGTRHVLSALAAVAACVRLGLAGVEV